VALRVERGRCAGPIVDQHRRNARREQIIAARPEAKPGSDRVERATEDNVTGARRSPWLVPDPTGTGRCAASYRPEDNENKQ
jgi:hypothetical protein